MTESPISRIKILPKNLINQIAAGEVIVRPASVAKELIENSIDAGAAQITVEVSDDVRTMTITDDGCGMTPEEAPLSLQRHATSKISTMEDIINVRTRGFRGEALASIAAVSRLTLTTRTPDSLSATRLEIEGGEILKTFAIGAPVGTSLLVRDIFFNTPARLKFMRSPSTELKRLLQVVTQQAMSHPEIGLILLSKNKKLLELPVQQSLEDRLRQILGSCVEGMLLPLHSGNLPVTIHGFVAKPEAGRKDRTAQFFFVNRRPISNRLLTVTFEKAYQGLLMTGRYPVGAIFVFVEPEDVDVNVHPTKEEVRFRDERMVGGIVHRVVSEALRKASLIPYTRLQEMPEAPVSPSGGKGQDAGGIFGSPTAALREGFRKKPFSPAQQTNLGFYESWGKGRIQSPSITSEIAVGSPRIPREIPEEEAPASGDKTAADFRESINQAEPIGQIAGMYIVALCGDALLLVDQHAAHERILYERISSRKTNLAIQPLLVPITFEVDATQVQEMEILRSRLQEFGFEVEHFGGQSFVIHSLPSDLSDVDAPALIRDLLDTLELRPEAGTATEWREEMARRLACHSAIKAGQNLSREEMIQLLRDLKKTALAFTCPHGRPTMILLTRGQLDRQFKRAT